MDLQISLSRRLEDSALSESERAQLRCQLSRRYEEDGNFQAACEAMGELWERIGTTPKTTGLDQAATAEVLLRAGVLSGWIGSAQQIEGAQEIAKNLIGQSRALFADLQESARVAETQSELAVCYWREGAYNEARIILQEALAQLGDESAETKALLLLRAATIERAAMRYQAALSILMEAAPLFESSNNHVLKGKFHGELGNIFEMLGPSEAREDYIDRALVEYTAASFHFEQARHTGYRARVENNLGLLFLMTRRFAEAHEHLDRARRLFLSLKDNSSVAQVDGTRARVFLAEGRHVEAEKTANAATRVLEQGDQLSLLAETLVTKGTALARLGRIEQARTVFERAVIKAEQAGDSDGAGLAALTLTEELSEHLTGEALRGWYERADQLLAHSQHPATLQRLRAAARRIISAHSARTQDASPAQHGFVYASGLMAQILRDAHRLAGTSHPILITGETGTGKKLLARLIHEWSGRSGKFVVVNCALLAETSVESILFGHRRGSFAGATKDEAGAVREAAGGTLLLEEIGALGIKEQTKLLRLIEHGEVHSIGAAQPERIEVRVIAATQSQLQEKLAEKVFREDLFYLLRSFHLEIPPLRERVADIPALAEHFIKEATVRYGERVNFTPEAIAAMQQLPLKGNARELSALIESTMLTAPHGTEITRGAIETIALRQTPSVDFTNAWAGCHLDEEVRIYEGKLIRQALAAADGRITHAARLLGVTHQCLAYILQGRQKDLLKVRTPVQRRRRSIIKIEKKAKKKPKA